MSASHPLSVQGYRTRSAWTRYAIGAALSASALLLTIAAAPWLASARFIFFFAAVVASALYGGRGPALLAAIVGVLGVNYYLLPPAGYFRAPGTADLAILATFFTIALLISSMMQSMRSAIERAERHAHEVEAASHALQARTIELEEQVDENQMLTEELEQQVEEAQSLNEELELANEQLTTALRVAELAREELVALEAENRNARERAEAANAAKSEFLTFMSHELRTPLNAIGGYAELLGMGIMGEVNDRQRESLERIRRSQHHLLGLINNILNYARLDAAQVEFRLESVELPAVLAEMLSLIEPQVRARGLEYRCHGCSTRVLVRADCEKLTQILVNLLSNAIKFTPAGGSIEVSVEDTPETVMIHVSDNGIGIPAQRLESIFDPFVQLGRELTSSSEGTGLGLAISRDLARGMSGEITVRSEPGRGSVFTIRLPRG